MKRCSQFWNGASTLIVPVRADGRFPREIREYLELRPVEACFVHDSIPASAHKKLTEQLGPALVRWWRQASEEFDEEEMHPLLLQPQPADATRRLLRVPKFGSPRQERIALAAWGHVDEADRPHYRNYFDVGDVTAPLTAHAAMLGGQTGGTSPLEQTMTLNETYGSLPIGRALYVFGTNGSFNELVSFWNRRSRNRDVRNRPMLFGVARESLEHPETLRPLVQLLEEDTFYAQTPDLGLVVLDRDLELATEALESLGFEADRGHQVSRRIGSGRGERPLSFGRFGPEQPGPFKRGHLIHEQVTISSGETSFRPPQPPGLPSTNHYIRLGIEGLPLPMPLTDETAEQMHRHAFASPEGLTIKTLAWIGESYMRVAVPSAWDALAGWAAAHGETVKLSAAGAFGQALLDRLGDLRALDALADENALAILHALAPTSRLKLAQRLVKEAAKQAGAELSEGLLAELLAEQAQFLELKARSAADIAGLAGLQKATVLPALGLLVEAGFVVRGAATRCPRCQIGAVLLLGEQSERVRCRACGHEYLLPVLEQNDKSERLTVYQLDGLMARAMDQDLLPVLLTLRACIPGDVSAVRAAWLGLEFESNEGVAEHDFLLSTGAKVTVAECKATASISDEQLRGLLRFAESHDARPVIGALAGTFPAPQKQAVIELGGGVFERADLTRD